MCSIKTFQIVWNVLNTSENLMKFPSFQDFLPFNSKQNLQKSFFQDVIQPAFVEFYSGQNDVRYVYILSKMMVYQRLR